MGKVIVAEGSDSVRSRLNALEAALGAGGTHRLDALEATTSGIVNVASYGATGNGSTDDTAAIQAALNAGAKSVFAPAGTYDVSLIEVPTGVEFFGAGPTLTIIKGAIRNKLNASYDQYHGAIRRLSVDGVDKAANGIDLLRPWFWRLEDVDIYNCLVGLRLRQAIVNTFINVRVHNNVVGCQAGAGMTSWADQTANALPTTINTFVNFNAFSNDQEGLRILEAKALQFSGGAIEANAVTGAVPYGVTLTYSAAQRELAVFDGVWFEGGPVNAHVYIDANQFAKSAIFNDCGFVPKGIAGNVERAIIVRAGIAEVNGANWQSDVFKQIGGSTAPFQIDRTNGGRLLYRGPLPKTDASDTTHGLIEDTAHDKTNIDGYAQAHIIDQTDSRYYGRTIQYVKQGQVAWQVRQDDGAGAWRSDPHFDIVNDGRLRWGSGAGAVDTQISRSAADTLGMGAGDSFKVDGTWNGGHLLLGNYHLWVDSTAKVRTKNGAPASETDGASLSQPTVSPDRGDTNQTLTVGTDAPIQRWATTLTANRTVTLSTTGARNGDTFRVVRTGLGAFTLDVGGLKTIPSATAAYVDVAYDGTVWRLTGYGAL